MAEIYDWHDQALCRERSDVDFFPEDGNVWPAIEVCKKCPVRRPCYDHSMEFREEYGVWGGIPAAERKRRWER